jgi:E-phenylitaconyl-CoA hydratase
LGWRIQLTILLSVADFIATVTLNRPEAMNSIDLPMRAELVDLWRRLNADDNVRVVVITGAGHKAFCTGSDLKNTMPPDEAYACSAFSGAGDHSFVDDLKIDKPVICAINGYALAGGLEIALSCDIRIASETAKFGLTEVKIGSIPGAGGTQRLPRLVGFSNALQMLLTAEMIDSAEALRIGLVSRVVPAGKLMEEALIVAAKIAANAPLAVRAVKRVVYRGAELPLDAAIEVERMAWGILRNTEDRIEGRVAFREKRSPIFKGR